MEGRLSIPQAVLLTAGPNTPFLQVPGVPKRSHRHPLPGPTFRALSPLKPAPLLRDGVPPERFAAGASFAPPVPPLGGQPGPAGARGRHPGKAAGRGGLGKASPACTRARRPPSPSGRPAAAGQARRAPSRQPPPPPAGAILACGAGLRPAGGSAAPGPGPRAPGAAPGSG